MAVRQTEAIAEDVERVLGAVLPAIDLVDVRVVPGGVLRVLIDHPDGVDHERCAEVGRALVAFRERYALEVSSPGIPRPLTKPAHYERFAAARPMSACTHRSRAVAASAASCSRATPSAWWCATRTALLEIPFAAISRAHLVEEL